jgi:hypothetical protein
MTATAFDVDHSAGPRKGEGLRHRRATERLMDYDDYLREEAAKYRKMADQTTDEFIRKELLELALVCEEVANSIEDRLTGG